MSETRTPAIYNIPPSVSFSDTLAAGLLEQVGEAQHLLASYLVLLPNRRACRALQEAFLRQTGGAPIMLPRMQPFGDVDAEELSLSVTAEEDLDIPPAMSALKRQILLAQAIARVPGRSQGAEQDMALAKALGTLMDQIHTEGLSISDLPALVDVDDISDHWNITVKFLEILSQTWPEILAEQGVIDSSDRRNRLINALNSHWQKNPPTHAVIAAGSTGSIPATAALLKTISMLPAGSLILPGLDRNLPKAAWNAIEEGHPQATLKILIDHIGVERENIFDWPEIKQVIKYDIDDTREKLISHVMAPANHTDQWQNVSLTPMQKSDVETSLNNVTRYDCNTPQDEALVIALLLRETLADKDKSKTAALITPDRNLSQRVAMICRQWNISLDDSGGKTLSESTLGSFLRLCATACINDVRPVSLLALLKHSKNQGAGFKNFRSVTRSLDKLLLRGACPTEAFAGYRTLYHSKISDDNCYDKPTENILNFIDYLEPVFAECLQKFSNKNQKFSTLLEVHLKLAEELASDGTGQENSNLWQGEEGEAAADFFSDLKEHAHLIPDLSPREYLEIIEQFMRGITIRPKFGTHPRLMILGQLEARLSQADRIILGGLNEGTWPPAPAHDPWMSRPMRQKFGLPVPERDITLAAHDFAQGFCGNEVFITRAKRADGTPTVPARWLQRLDTFLEAVEISPDIIRDDTHNIYASMLNNVKNIEPVKRPAPKPPIDARPRKLSVTKIEKWLKDPYNIYAEKILRLRALDVLEKQPDAAERGTVMHELMERFTKKYRNDVPHDARNNFITMARDVLDEYNFDPVDWSFWSPRMARLADWIVPHEQQWRQKYKFLKSEIKGHIDLQDNLTKPFTLEARVDRIDKSIDGHAAIIDYKSGGSFSVKKMQSAELPQLPLEALILNEDGFSEFDIKDIETSNISYWVLSGSKPAGKITALDGIDNLEKSVEVTRAGLTKLIQTFDNIDTPYYAIPRLDNAPTYNDFEYLERVKEWAALGETAEDAA